MSYHYEFPQNVRYNDDFVFEPDRGNQAPELAAEMMVTYGSQILLSKILQTGDWEEPWVPFETSDGRTLFVGSGKTYRPGTEMSNCYHLDTALMRVADPTKRPEELKQDPGTNPGDFEAQDIFYVKENKVDGEKRHLILVDRLLRSKSRPSTDNYRGIKPATREEVGRFLPEMWRYCDLIQEEDEALAEKLKDTQFSREHR